MNQIFTKKFIALPEKHIARAVVASAHATGI
jgi:hypothetical protein